MAMRDGSREINNDNGAKDGSGNLRAEQEGEGVEESIGVSTAPTPAPAPSHMSERTLAQRAMIAARELNERVLRHIGIAS